MKKAAIITFIAVPLIIACLIFLSDDTELSESENRMLRTRAALSSDVLDGSFQKGLEDWLSDQFPLRLELKRAENEIRAALGAQEIGGAYICREKAQSKAEKSSGKFRLFQKITEADVDKAACLRYADSIGILAAESGLPVYVMYVPSAGSVFRDMLPGGAPMYSFEKLCSMLKERMITAEQNARDADPLQGADRPENGASLKIAADGSLIVFVDLLPALAEDPDNYYKTDHHWSTDGACAAYKAWLQAHGEDPKEADRRGKTEFTTVTDSFRGTLFSKVLSEKTAFDSIRTPKEPEGLKITADGREISLFDSSALDTRDKYNYFQGGNYGIVAVENTKKQEGRTLLILKDSFANSFLPFIADDYRRIIMLDERYSFEDPLEIARSCGADEIAVIREIVSR